MWQRGTRPELRSPDTTSLGVLITTSLQLEGLSKIHFWKGGSGLRITRKAECRRNGWHNEKRIVTKREKLINSVERHVRVVLKTMDFSQFNAPEQTRLCLYVQYSAE